MNVVFCCIRQTNWQILYVFTSFCSYRCLIRIEFTQQINIFRFAGFSGSAYNKFIITHKDTVITMITPPSCHYHHNLSGKSASRRRPGCGRRNFTGLCKHFVSLKGDNLKRDSSGNMARWAEKYTLNMAKSITLAFTKTGTDTYVHIITILSSSS